MKCIDQQRKYGGVTHALLSEVHFENSIGPCACISAHAADDYVETVMNGDNLDAATTKMKPKNKEIT